MLQNNHIREAEKHVALMYNLLEGYSYFFKSYSTDVIGQVLTVPRNGKEKDYTIKGQMVLP